MKNLLLNSVLIFLLVFLPSCKSKKAAAPVPPSYRTMVLDTTSAVVYTEYSAVIQSQSVIEIRPKVSGYLVNIAVNEGDWVKKGTLLFQIDDSDFKQNVNAAKAGMQSAKANADNAALEVKKITPLVEKGIISPFELETKTSNLEAAKASYAQAKAEYENALIQLGYTSISAPTTGVLGRIYVREGSLVSSSASDPLTTISSEGDVSAYFSFDEKKLAPIRKKELASGNYEPARSKVVELVKADGEIYEYKGMLESATGIIDRTTGSIQLKVIFPNPKMEILSGSSGILRFPITYKGCITVPQSATYELQNKIMVFIVNADNTVSSKSIIVEGVSGQNYVVSEGLKAGDRIVIEGANKLKEDTVITPKDE